MSTSSRTNVLLAGAAGIPGHNILGSLQKCSKELNLYITILKCSSSAKARSMDTLPSPSKQLTSTTRIQRSLAEKLASTITTLSLGIVISALNAEPEPELDNVLLTAATAAGVKLGQPMFYINGYTLDIMHASAAKYSTYLAPKVGFAKRLAREVESGNIGYCTIVNAGFINYVLMKGYAGIDLKEHKAPLFDSGMNKLTGCSLRFVGDAVAEVVRLVAQGEGD